MTLLSGKQKQYQSRKLLNFFPKALIQEQINNYSKNRKKK